MLIPNTELKYVSDEVGNGVFTKKFIPKGTLVWVKTELDIIVSASNEQKFKNELSNQFEFRNNKGEHLLLHDNARFINHSFKANCIVTVYNFFIAVFDIFPDEEITIDYGTLNIKKPIVFNTNTEEDTVNPNDIILYHSIWDKRVENAMKNFKKVNQYIEECLVADVKKELNLISLGIQKMPSILNCYYENESIKQ